MVAAGDAAQMPSPARGLASVFEPSFKLRRRIGFGQFGEERLLSESVFADRRLTDGALSTIAARGMRLRIELRAGPTI